MGPLEELPGKAKRGVWPHVAFMIDVSADLFAQETSQITELGLLSQRK